MEPLLKLYVAAWSLACVVALVVAWRHRRSLVITQASYWHFLAEPWKLLTFVVASALITLIAPYTGDPTWDYADGLFMSVFCFASAPWVVAELYHALHGRSSAALTFVAVCAWMFSASWSYDGYLLWRDGAYPITWFVNIFASGVIYLSAGLFWNLEWHPPRGVIFSFMREGWPTRAAVSAPLRFALYALVLAGPAVYALVVFFI